MMMTNANEGSQRRRCAKHILEPNRGKVGKSKTTHVSLFEIVYEPTSLEHDRNVTKCERHHCRHHPSSCCNKANEIILLLWNIHKQQHRIPGARERETTDEFEEAVSGERRRLLREQLNASSLARRVDVVPVAAAAFVLHLPSRIAFKRKKKKKKKN